MCEQRRCISVQSHDGRLRARQFASRAGNQSAMSTFVLTDVSSEVWQESFTLDATGRGAGRRLRVVGHQAPAARRPARRGRPDRRRQRCAAVFDRADAGHGPLERLVRRQPGGLGFAGHRRTGPSRVRQPGGHGGLGWLDGFDELLARCGLENNGAPYEVKTKKPDGSESNTTYGLHGKIANIPASYVAVHIGTEPPHEIVDRGTCRRVAPLRAANPDGDADLDRARVQTPGRARRVHQPQGPAGGDADPLPLEFRAAVPRPGARFVAPIAVGHAARRASAASGSNTTTAMPRPSPATPSKSTTTSCSAGRTATGARWRMLRNHAGDKGVVLRFRQVDNCRPSLSGRTPPACATVM